MKIPVYNMGREKIATIELNKDIFEGEVKRDLLQQIRIAHQKNCRQGTVSTKRRGEVSGGGRKPWSQKGTGRARVGSIRSPLWVGGGVSFGPKPRNFEYRLPRKVKKVALKSSLREKLKKESLLILNKVEVKEGKTKEMVKFLDAFSIKGKCLLVVDKWDEKVRRSSSNLKKFVLSLASIVSAYDILSHPYVFLTKDSLSILERRLKDE